MTQPLSADDLRRIDAYWRAANFLSVGQIYLYDNPLLREPLVFDMCVLNRIDRYHLVQDVIARVPGLADTARAVKQAMESKLAKHRDYIRRHGDDMPEVRDWKWGPS
jgi:phosphoketolase